ncbi:MAG: 16S rRNA (uracil(1498)-N(3))-methyltransferase [Prevotellaceae bacterium]|jgi:16S rRNA (uracil1498-N3)-methyltransferase|nr:16S rRNA (uracil(1498)-N(3))-methyltransferase [Prevotellaceae bacterium]
MQQLFYSEIIENEICVLTSEESKHCIGVLRHRNGDIVYIFSRSGEIHTAKIINDSPKECILNIIDTKPVYRRPEFLHIAIAPTKNVERFEWFVEKAVEIGIEEITPLFCEHSERRALKTDRIEKIVVSAMKQSLNLNFPKINQPVDFKDLIRMKFKEKKCIAYCEEKTIFFSETIAAGFPMLTLVGPEGDFSKQEIEMAISRGFTPVSLGRNRLRTETAGLAVCTIFQSVTGDPRTENNGKKAGGHK